MTRNDAVTYGEFDSSDMGSFQLNTANESIDLNGRDNIVYRLGDLDANRMQIPNRQRSWSCRRCQDQTFENRANAVRQIKSLRLFLDGKQKLVDTLLNAMPDLVACGERLTSMD
jgi:hypothetical protein